MNPFFVTDFSISDSLKTVRKSVLIYETIIHHQQRQVARLQEYRKRICLSQKELAEKADVPLRTIQQYEQKQKNINHARADYVIRLAKALYCRPEDLLEVETLQ
ncbi:MAG: helix-turn-helix transcriptional regulator [Agathobacter sp.]|nr:helix-turn-helix transcriptional regulator [Agathobacter sp.]